MVIDLTKILNKRKAVHPGMQILRALPEDDANQIVQVIMEVILKEVRIGLGLEPGTDELKFFELVNDVYKEYYGGCFFCDIEVEDSNQICIIHHKKLVDYLSKYKKKGGE